jgi:hypothetical protein
MSSPASVGSGRQEEVLGRAGEKRDEHVTASFRRLRTAILTTMKQILCVLYLVLTCSMLSGPIIYNLARQRTGEALHWSSLLIGLLLASGLLWVASRLWDQWPSAFAWVAIAIGSVLLRKALLVHKGATQRPIVPENAAIPHAMVMVASALMVSAAVFLIHGAIRRIRLRHSER